MSLKHERSEAGVEEVKKNKAKRDRRESVSRGHTELRVSLDLCTKSQQTVLYLWHPTRLFDRAIAACNSVNSLPRGGIHWWSFSPACEIERLAERKRQNNEDIQRLSVTFTTHVDHEMARDDDREIVQSIVLMTFYGMKIGGIDGNKGEKAKATTELIVTSEGSTGVE